MYTGNSNFDTLESLFPYRGAHFYHRIDRAGIVYLPIKIKPNKSSSISIYIHQLLPFVTWIDHPNGGRTFKTPWKKSRIKHPQKGHERKKLPCDIHPMGFFATLVDVFSLKHITLEPQTTIKKWTFGETTISYVKIGNHPIETAIYKWLFGVPGQTPLHSTAPTAPTVRWNPTSSWKQSIVQRHLGLPTEPTLQLNNGRRHRWLVVVRLRPGGESGIPLGEDFSPNEVIQAVTKMSHHCQVIQAVTFLSLRSWLNL